VVDGIEGLRPVFRDLAMAHARVSEDEEVLVGIPFPLANFVEAVGRAEVLFLHKPRWKYSLVIGARVLQEPETVAPLLPPRDMPMAFHITITVDADSQMRALTTREQRVLEAAICARLQDRPTTPTRAIKKLRPNPLAEFELRAGDLRVLYNVEG